MFQTAYSKWYNSLPKHTQVWMKNQAIWHDRDIAFALCVGLAIGFIIGWIV